MIKGLKADGFNLVMNVKEASGQEIMHTHLHIIPRFENDGLRMPPLNETSEEDRLLFAEKIITNLHSEK